MLSAKEKTFYVDIAFGARALSPCTEPRGAVVVRDRQLLSHGYNRYVIKGEKWEVSAIYDALFGAPSNLIAGSSLFCTFFPTPEDLIMIVSLGVLQLNFCGDVTNAESVLLLNKITAAGLPLEIINLT